LKAWLLILKAFWPKLKETQDPDYKGSEILEKSISKESANLEAVQKLRAELKENPYTVHQSRNFMKVAALLKIYSLVDGKVTIQQDEARVFTDRSKVIRAWSWYGQFAYMGSRIVTRRSEQILFQIFLRLVFLIWKRSWLLSKRRIGIFIMAEYIIPLKKTGGIQEFA